MLLINNLTLAICLYIYELMYLIGYIYELIYLIG